MDVRIVAYVLLGLNFSLAWAEPPAAPPHSPPASASQALERSQVVFVGKVVSVKKDKLGFNSLAQVEVVKSIRGKLAGQGQVQVSGEGGPTHPARIFQAGQTWLFYLGSDLHADSYANRVVPEDRIEADLKSLRRKPITGQIPEPGNR